MSDGLPAIRVVSVFLGSPGGLSAERDAIADVVEDLNAKLRAFGVQIDLRSGDDHGPAGGRPQEDISTDVNRCQIFVGLLYTHMGSDSGRGVTGFEEEYQTVVDRRGSGRWPRPLLWFKDVPREQRNDPGERLKRVLAFQQGLIDGKNDFFRRFTTLEQLRSTASQRIWEAVVELTAIAEPAPESLLTAQGDERQAQLPPPAPLSIEHPRIDFGQVLTAGPLAGIEDGLRREEDATALAIIDPRAAARLLEELADQVEAADRSMVPAGEELRSRAAVAHARADRLDHACDLVRRTLRRRIRRDSSFVQTDIGRLRDWLPEHDRWQADAWEACASWPDNVDRARAVLERLRSRSEYGTAPREDRRYWLRMLAELHLLRGDVARAEIAAEAVAPGEPLDVDELLALLVAAEARERGAGAASSDEVWSIVTRQVADAATPPELKAIVAARRGVSLTRAGEHEAARAAFDDAAILWGGVSGAQNQVAEMYFASQSASLLGGEWFARGHNWRPLAVSLRGDADTPDERASALERRGLESRLTGHHIEARRSYWFALLEHRRAGDLRGEQFLWHLLGELYENGRRHGDAVAAYIAGGREDDALRVARDAEPGDVYDELVRVGPRWQRAASLAALGSVGRRLTPEQGSDVVSWVLDEIASGDAASSGPQVLPRAIEAIAAIVLTLQGGELSAALSHLRRLALSQDIRLAKPAAEALMIVTNAGISIETDVLVDAFLSNAASARIPWLWVGEQVTQEHPSFGLLKTAALAGRSDAASALAIVDGAEDDDELRTAADRRIESVLSSPPGRDDDGNVIGLLSLEGLGLAGRHADTELKCRLVEWLVEFALSSEQPQINRQSACNALVNLASGLDTAAAGIAAQALVPIALGRAELSPWDSTRAAVEDPFNPVRIGFTAAAEGLQGAALEAAAALADRAGETPADLPTAIDDAWASLSPTVAAAAWKAVGRCGLVDVPPTLAAGLVHPDWRVRSAALGCVRDRRERVLNATIVRRLLGDEAPAVRFALIQAASAIDDTTTVERLAQDDIDAYVRALARKTLRDRG